MPDLLERFSALVAELLGVARLLRSELAATREESSRLRRENQELLDQIFELQSAAARGVRPMDA